MRASIIVMVALATVIAGCTTPAETDDGTNNVGANDDSVNNTTLGPEVFSGTGTILASAGSRPTGGGGFSQGGVIATVEDGATILHAEIRWNDPVSDIDLALSSPDAQGQAGETNFDHTAEGGLPGAPDSPHSYTVTDPSSGEWFGGALANGATANVEFEIVITVFYEESAVPDGYTAFP